MSREGASGKAGGGPLRVAPAAGICELTYGREMLLQDQVALVTGGGRGIGRATALRLAHEGAGIAIIDVDGETAEATSREINALGRRAVFRIADVSDHASIGATVQELVQEFGRLDVLVNNAGVETRSPFLEITPADWERQIAVNLTGTFNCSQAAAREMATREYGRIVNITSVAGLIGPIDLAAYGAAKAGIVGLTRAAALDLADLGITVNAIAPGPIETELMLGAWSAEALRERPQHGAIARFGTVEEVAHTALFLASPDSGFITGVTISVDGGAVAAGAYMVEKYRRRKAATTDGP
jgi:3-oxoacyl-[acyl-carrier protein] reductase